MAVMMRELLATKLDTLRYEPTAKRLRVSFGSHLVADTEVRDVGTNGGDPAAALQPERHRPVGQAGVEPQGLHDVAKVQGRRLDLDLDQARPRLLSGRRPWGQAVQHGSPRNLHPVGRSLFLGRQS